MALTERSRAALYQGLTAIIEDEEAVAEMLSQFPSRDTDELVTRGDVTVFRADTRSELSAMRAEIDAFRTEMRAEIDAFRSEMRAEFAEFREQMRVEMHLEFRRMMVWNVSTMLALATIIVAAMAALR